MDLANAVCIVTGSATGVGAACAKRLSARGARVVVNFTKSEKEARQTEEECRAVGAETLLVRADVSVDADCRRMAQAALDRWGQIDALINNAGVTTHSDPFDLETLNAGDFQRIFGVNVIGAFQMIRAVAPGMKLRGGGAVVNISSNVAVTGGGSSICYTASKGALNAMTLALARVLGPEIRVNAVCPGVINTRWMRDAVGAEGYAALAKRFQDTAPLARVAEPEDVSEPVVWLLEGADYVTGETLFVDGGIRLAGGAPRRRT